jgi:hypothetical protein
MGKITLRFVTGSDELSAMIRFQAGLSMPFTPSHCEAVSQDGKTWIGQHLVGGMLARPAGYDAAELMTLPDGTKSQKFVVLPCTDEQETAFYAHVNVRIGAPYDWKSIVSFIDPAWNLHEKNHLICSAEMVWGLRACNYFLMPLTVPYHHISPRDLFLILSSHVQIDH